MALVAVAAGVVHTVVEVAPSNTVVAIEVGRTVLPEAAAVVTEAERKAHTQEGEGEVLLAADCLIVVVVADSAAEAFAAAGADQKHRVLKE